MTTTTDLLRRAARAMLDASDDTPSDQLRQELRDLHVSLLALADQMERAEPVAVRQWHDEFKCWNYDDIEDVLPSCKGERLYTHPAPEVTRDAERYRWLRDGIATERGEPWVITRYAPGDERNRDGGTCPLAGDELDAAIDAAMQEPKP